MDIIIHKQRILKVSADFILNGKIQKTQNETKKQISEQTEEYKRKHKEEIHIGRHYNQLP